LFDLLKQVFNVHSLLVEDEGVREVLDEFSKVIVKHSKDEVSAAPLTLLFQSIVSLMKNMTKLTLADPLTFLTSCRDRVPNIEVLFLAN
jgi:hypothetical protein